MLSINLKGFPEKFNSNFGYAQFSLYRHNLELGFNDWANGLIQEQKQKCSHNEVKLNELIDRINKQKEILNILLTHSDCDGRLTHNEARKIYKVIKKLEYHEDLNFSKEQFNKAHANWLRLLKFSMDHRRTMIFC